MLVDVLCHIKSPCSTQLVVGRFLGNLDVMGMTFTRAGDELLVCQGNNVSMWNRRSNEERALGVDSGAQKLSIAIAPDDATVVCGDNEGNIHLWNRTEGKVIKSFVGHEDHVDP